MRFILALLVLSFAIVNSAEACHGGGAGVGRGRLIGRVFGRDRETSRVSASWSSTSMATTSSSRVRLFQRLR